VGPNPRACSIWYIDVAMKAFVTEFDMQRVHEGDNEHSPVIDELNLEQDTNGFQVTAQKLTFGRRWLKYTQELLLNVPEASDGAFFWPAEFEKHLQSLTRPVKEPRTRAQNRTGEGVPSTSPSFRFEASGRDNDL